MPAAEVEQGAIHFSKAVHYPRQQTANEISLRLTFNLIGFFKIKSK